MRLLELLCGENQSWSKAGRALGFQCVCLDWSARCVPDLCMDVRDFWPEGHGHFDIVCASPDCRELSQARRVDQKKGNGEFADSVGQACVSIIQFHVARGAVGILENPQQALPKRPWMAQYAHLSSVVDYCMWSGPRPADFDGSSPSKQNLGDWHPARKPTSIYVFGGPTQWQPSRARCKLLSGSCGFCDERGLHICWSRHCGDRQQIEVCRARGYPHVFSTAELHRIPSALCRELLEHAAACVASRREERERDAAVPGVQGDAAEE